MPAAGFSSANTSSTGQLREYLGLSQQQLADYLGTNRVRVADAEAYRRMLSGDADTRLTYLRLLLPPGWPAHLAPPPGPVLPPAPAPLPIGAPPAPGSAILEKEWRGQLRRARHDARLLRFRLENQRALGATLAHTHAHQVALLAAFAAPPPLAVTFRQTLPDLAPARTARWLERLTSRISTTADDLAAARGALARGELKLYLLEAEAATLAAWLAAWLAA